MEFRILGNLEVWVERQLPPLRPRQERLLARLLLSPNKIVSIGTLAEALWDDEPPDSAERQVQNAASQLRGSWMSAGVGDAKRVVRTVRSGYVLQVGPDALDVAVFRSLVAEAAKLEEEREAVEAIRRLRQGLALWRGPALAGISSAIIEANAILMNEERIAAWEKCLELELQTGRHRHVLTELVGLVSEFPFQERLTGLLMIAFYRTGRQRDALRAYLDARERLNSDLGIDPGPDLRRLHQRILRNDQTLLGSADDEADEEPKPPTVSSTRTTVPSQVPPSVGRFTGRREELKILTHESGRVQVIVVTGAGGMGKTSLVAQWAQLNTKDFPDGQLFLDLHGHDLEASRSPDSILEYLVESLRVPYQEIPRQLDKRISLYRSVISQRKMLIVLDNAGSIDQILPAIPVGSGTHLIVTSRNRLAALHTYAEVRNLTLGPLSRDDSLSILTGYGDEASPGIRNDPAVENLIELCGGMPLALRILRARILSESLLTLSQLASEISHDSATLDGFVIDGDSRSVRSVIASAYAALAPADARVFQLLAVHPGRLIRWQLAAAITGLPPATARRHVERLVAMHLVNEVGEGFVVMHDLVRHFAVENLRAAAGEGRPAEAVARLLAWYGSMAAAANRVLRPDRDAYPDASNRADDAGPFLEKEAIDFFNAERENLAPVTSLAMAHDVDTAIALIYNLHSYFVRTGFPCADVEVWRTCVKLAQGAAKPKALAHLHHAIGGALAVNHELDEALTHLSESAELYESEGDLSGAAGARLGSGFALEAKGGFDDALVQNERALALAHSAGNVRLTIHALINSADTLVALGRLDAGLQRLEMALDVARRVNEKQYEAFILNSIGALLIRQQDYRGALYHLHQSLDGVRLLGIRTVEAEVAYRIGVAQRGEYGVESAEPWLRRALDLYRRCEDAAGEKEVLKMLGELVNDER